MPVVRVRYVGMDGRAPIARAGARGCVARRASYTSLSKAPHDQLVVFGDTLLVELPIDDRSRDSGKPDRTSGMGDRKDLFPMRDEQQAGAR
jgi:hypothetical protein